MSDYIVDRTAQSVIFPIRIKTDGGLPIESLQFNTVGLSIDYMINGQSSWTSIALVVGTQGTFVSRGFVERSGADGWYELGLPNAAITPGKATDIRVKTAGNEYRYGSISATGIGTITLDAGGAR